MRRVILESPYAGTIPEETLRNVEYARRCLRDSLQRGEAPIASHLLYTQPGVLRDEVPEERQQGIDAGLAWREVAEASVVYTDLGISSGMAYGILKAKEAGRPVEIRHLGNPSPDGMHCGDCAYLEPAAAAGGIPPTGCSLLQKDLIWHDYWMAECRPDATQAKSLIYAT